LEVVLVLGVTMIAAAIVGGGLSAAGASIPVIASRSRQIALAAFGLALVLVSLLVQQRVPASTATNADREPNEVHTSGDMSPAIAGSQVGNINIGSQSGAK
jgi:hypothetical protein